MQQRFCTCGRSIWVEFRFSPAATWQAVFLPINSPRRAVLSCCPSCGLRLDINALR